MFKLLDTIATTSSRNEKQKLLTDNKSNELLKRIIFLTYSPTIVFGIKQIPNFELGKVKYTLEQAVNIIEQKFVVEKVRGNAAQDILADLLANLRIDDGILISRIISRDLRIGCNESTFNKVWPGLIPEMPVMLATACSDKALKSITYPAAAELKADGARCIAVIESKDDIKLMSRNGKQYQGLERIKSWLKMSDFEGFVLDGELIYTDKNGVADRQTGNGIVNKSLKETISDQEQRQIQYIVWDIIPYDVYFGVSNAMNAPYSLRSQLLRLELGKLFYGESNPCIKPIPTITVDTIDEARAVYRQYVEQGMEGIILKNLDAPWENKRSKNLVKFKEELTADMRIISIEAGDVGKKFESMMGRMRIASEDGLIDCYCGIGDADTNSLTDDVRQDMYNNKEKYTNKIVEIKYNGIIEDKSTGVKALFLPRYVRVREDKNVANSLSDLT